MGYQRSSNRNFPASDSYSALRMKNDSTVWLDANFTPLPLTLGASPPDYISYNGTGIQVVAFDGVSTAEEVSGGTEYNHHAKQGADIIFHLHWSPTTNDAGNVKWQLEYVWANIDSAAMSSTTISVIQAASGTAWDHQKISFPAISGTGKTIGSQIGFRLFRDPSDSEDTYAADAAITFTFGIHYELDTMGSRGTTSK